MAEGLAGGRWRKALAGGQFDDHRGQQDRRGEIEFQQLAGNGAIPEREFRFGKHSQAFRQPLIPGQHKQLPSGKILPEVFAQPGIERHQWRHIAESFAVGGIGNDHSRFIHRGSHLLDIDFIEGKATGVQMGPKRVVPGGFELIGRGVTAEDRSGEFPELSGAQFGQFPSPETSIEIGPFFAGKRPASPTGGNVQGHLGRFNHKGPRSAHRVEQGNQAIPASQLENGGGQCLLERGRSPRLLAVSPLVQTTAPRRIEAQCASAP